MTKQKFIELVVEKIILASVVATFSTAILFSYNLFSRSFDAAREQSRNFSSFAIKSKETVLTATAEVEVALNGLFHVFRDKSEAAGRRDIAFRMYSQLAQLNSAINVLAGFQYQSGEGPKAAFPKSVGFARSINTQLRSLAASYDQKTNRLIEIDDLKKPLDKIDADESQFVVAFNNELGAALSKEFEQFYGSYYLGVPWYARPTVLFILALVSLVACMVTLLLLPGEKSSTANDIT
ncbi:hypothetical protein [Tardiphaga sp. OK245]|uniref:hypothetical protein n=1 Tax=Tardiphaga sp. OK245 TaxID=1855306 RepID=UPI0008A74347|nr:hypothetical protein [Tardiphaga sp. OK245]SEH40783.1 hypothetical protein SAMN05216367_0072 [Tardiphaga sp. OK245]